MLWLLAACAFVEPEVDPVDPGPPDEVRHHIDARRDALQLTDGGAELWRAADAHGTLLRWRTLGPPTPITAAGPVDVDDPRRARLFAPFDHLDRDAPSLRYAPHPVLEADGTTLHLDEITRRVTRIDDAAGTWRLDDHRDVERLVLPYRLTDPDGHTLLIERYDWPSQP